MQVRLPFFLCLLMATGLPLGCASQRSEPGDRLQHLGHHTFKVTAANSDAQTAFDRGLTLAYGFAT